MKRAQVFLRKHSSTILTVVGAGGVITTAVLAVKATPKAMLLLEEAEKEKGEELTVVETVKAAWKPYIPATISGISTITCIFGANLLNKRTQASLVSAYGVLDKAYREYVNKTEELLKDNTEINIKQEIAKAKFDEDMVLDGEKELFFDFQSMRYFESTFEEVKRAERIFNQNMMMSGFGCLNEFYDILGIPYHKRGLLLSKD